MPIKWVVVSAELPNVHIDSEQRQSGQAQRVNSQGPPALKGEEGEADSNPLVVTADELVQAVHVVRVHGREPRWLKGTVPSSSILRGDGDVTVWKDTEDEERLTNIVCGSGDVTVWKHTEDGERLSNVLCGIGDVTVWKHTEDGND